MEIRIGAIVAMTLTVVGSSASVARAQSCDGRWHVVDSVDVAHHFGDFNSLAAVAAASPNDVWAVGEYDRFAKQSFYHTLAEHWDGTAWSAVPTVDSSMPNNLLSGVAATSSSDAWAVGYEGPPSGYYYTLIEHWNGRAWSIVQNAAVTGLLNGVSALSATDVWAVGSTNYVGRGLIEHWDGKRWKKTLLGPGVLLNSVLELSPTDVWAVGFKTTAQGSGEGDDTFTVHFDGMKWTHIPSPSPLKLHPLDQNWLRSVTGTGPNDVWAVGVTRDTDYGILDQTLAEHWDGTKWKLVSTPDPGGSGMYNDLWGAVALGSGAVWAVGQVGLSSFAPISEQWDGKHWKAVHTPSLQGALIGVAQASGTDVWATGNRVQRLKNTRHVYNGTLVEHLCTGPHGTLSP